MTDTTQNIKAQPRDAKGRVIGNSPMLAITEALNAALISIRQRNPEVPNVTLVVGTASRTKYGHFSPGAWDGKAPHEIMLSGESLKRGAVDVLGTLIHECAHASAEVQGIKDTSRQGRFHNKKFKEVGEGMGLILANDSRIGWSITSVPKATQELYKREISALAKALKAYRIPESEKPKIKTTIRLVSPDGERKVTVPIKFYEAGTIYDEFGEPYEPVEGGERENEGLSDEELDDIARRIREEGGE